ncbi:hypothetical protein DVH24_039014 [Malus domestica]|uniref:Disease resistance protein winged helix domain-containing protein n=1 Tax=Malus domestica TaxID=3750 RepID=A0A498K8Y0_MALDO|nr:hypothetical protein DVH24_039014 [Malus domestica]
MISLLKLSFDNLKSSSLKQCFAYCSVFMKDFKIERDSWVQQWMAQGLLHLIPEETPEVSNLEMEDIVPYFKMLHWMANTITKCKMSNLVHDLTGLVSKSESLRETYMRRMIHLRKNCKTKTGENALIVVFIIIIFGQREVLVRIVYEWRSNILPRFRGLRVLNLYKSSIEEFPISIGNMKRLRVSERSKEMGRRIEELASLNHLNAIPNQPLCHLRFVRTHFRMEWLDRRAHNDEGDVLEGLQPHLKQLEIDRMDSLKFIGAEFYGYDLVYDAAAESTETMTLFPSLKTL